MDAAEVRTIQEEIRRHYCRRKSLLQGPSYDDLRKELTHIILTLSRMLEDAGENMYEADNPLP